MRRLRPRGPHRRAAAAPRGAAAGGGGGPSLTPEYAAKKQAFDANPPEDNETANCLPPGMPGIMGQPYPMEFLLTPGKVTIVIEAYKQVRHIYTDGRAAADRSRSEVPRHVRRSLGRRHARRRDRRLLAADAARSAACRTAARCGSVERFRLTDPDTMTIETTITDPDALTAPYTSNRTLSAIATGPLRNTSARRTTAIRSMRAARPVSTCRARRLQPRRIRAMKAISRYIRLVGILTGGPRGFRRHRRRRITRLRRSTSRWRRPSPAR